MQSKVYHYHISSEAAFSGAMSDCACPRVDQNAINLARRSKNRLCFFFYARFSPLAHDIQRGGKKSVPLLPFFPPGQKKLPRIPFVLLAGAKIDPNFLVRLTSIVEVLFCFLDFIEFWKSYFCQPDCISQDHRSIPYGTGLRSWERRGEG